MTLIFETENNGRLWLGGDQAAHNSKLLADNEIYAVLPAYRGAVPDSPNVFVLETVDGTAACNGDVPLDKVMECAIDVVALLQDGKSVLVACHNGAHRSSTLACLVLMRLTAWSAQDASSYLATMRNIVDLGSRAPPSRHRQFSKRPLDWLEEIQDQVRPSAAVAFGKTALGFVPLRRKALENGFVARYGNAKSLATPGARRRESSSEETAQSLDFPTDVSQDEGASARGSQGFDKAGWTFVGTPVSTPGGSSCGEGSELRRRKLQLLIQDLSALNSKLVSRVEAAEAATSVLEPSLTLTEASGQTAAVVVQGKLTTAPALAPADTQAIPGKESGHVAASEPGVPGSGKEALEPGAPPSSDHAASEPGAAIGPVADVKKEKEIAAAPVCKAEVKEEKETASKEPKTPADPSGGSVAAFVWVSAEGVNRSWPLISNLSTPKNLKEVMDASAKARGWGMNPPWPRLFRLHGDYA